MGSFTVNNFIIDLGVKIFEISICIETSDKPSILILPEKGSVLISVRV